MEAKETYLVVALAAIAGAAGGSFGAVVASRGWRGSTQGRSHCDSCGRGLGWYEMVPLVSYLALRGRCRTCSATVPIAALLWEAGGALTGAAIAVIAILALAP